MIRFLNYIYRTFFFDPLAGGNGKIQMDEIAKAILLTMICVASFREGKSNDQVYPDIYWIMIFASVCAIAAIKPAFGKKEVHNDVKESV
jgi:hypothetical protein